VPQLKHFITISIHSFLEIVAFPFKFIVKVLLMIFYKIGLNKVALELMFFCLWLTKFCNILFSPIISHIKMDDNL
jgi:hypothetical protein